MPHTVTRAQRTALRLAACLLPLWPAAAAGQAADALARQVEVRRTAYGVPHIHAENLRAAGYALGYVQAEDYGERVVRGLARARGELSLHFGPDSVDVDASNRRAYLRALETYHLLEQDTRDVMEGFAAGVARFVELHRADFPEWTHRAFTGHDVHALGIGRVSTAAALRLVRRAEGGVVGAAPQPDADEGSNAWALAPSRTRSGRAILLRNPHLAWSAGYYEAHLTVPGVLDFYGDFRVGSPLGIIGGFNRHLGWSTTNNATATSEVYALDVDPARPDHYLFDGGSVPLTREETVVEYRAAAGRGRAVRETWSTPLGPVVHRTESKVYVLRAAGDGEYRGGEQFLRMMRARSLEEWKDAMRMQARSTSNFTYADARGNIFYVWNAALPSLPHAPGGDSLVHHARGTRDVWTRVVAWDSLPQLLNPRGGYLRNENDSPHYTNLHQVLDAGRYPPNHEQPNLRMRSQLAIELIHDTGRLSLEDVLRLKHTPRMLLADRVKPELLAALRAAGPLDDEVRAAAALLERWDNTAAAGSRGGVLFEIWWRRYEAEVGAANAFRVPWSRADPVAAPRGLAHPARAADAFAWAVTEAKRRHGAWDVAWGEVHRVRRGDVDEPVSGCSGALGCFRVLTFQDAPDGRRVVNGGDGWVLAVEFTDTPRAYTVLAYGQSPDPASPHHADQAALFARGEMKRVAFSRADVERQTVRRYRPGLPPEPR
jgi:acyl-homoserine-lactone acylase